MAYEGDDDRDDEALLHIEAEPNEEGEEQDRQEGSDEGEIETDFDIDDGSEPETVEGDYVRIKKTDLDQIRGKVREQSRDLYAMRRTQAAQPIQKPVEVGEKPTLEGCDWDQDKFEAEYDQWQQRKTQRERQDSDAARLQENQSRQFEDLRTKHNARAATLRIPDYPDREKAIFDILGSELAGAAMIMLGNNSANVVAAVGNKPALLDKLEAEQDPLRKLAMLKDWEYRMNKTRKTPPAPEAGTIQRGSAPLTREDPSKKLASLEKKARETGNRTELIAYKREQRQKQQGKAA